MLGVSESSRSNPNGIKCNIGSYDNMHSLSYGCISSGNVYYWTNLFTLYIQHIPN